MTKIGILGSGEVAKALSRAFMGHGYRVVLGSDHVEKTAEFKKENPELKLRHLSSAQDLLIWQCFA